MNRAPYLVVLGIGLAAACSSEPLTAPDSGTAPQDAAEPDAVAQPLDAEAASDAGTVSDAQPEDAARDAGTTDAKTDAGRPPGMDPFAPQPDTSEGLTNISADINALLEGGQLDGACAAYEANPTDRRLKLLCGKWMFFYETYDTGGVPAPIIDFMTESFPNEVGPGFEQMGMVLDPASPEMRPLGMVPGVPFGNVDSLVYTCAACHFGQLPDGRYAVGYSNHNFDYAKQVLAIALIPGSVTPGFDPSEHDAAALARVQPMIDVLAADRALRLRLLLDLLPLIGAAGMQPNFTPLIEGQYASWPPGTMDFVITPLPLDDEAHTVSKIISLWGIPDAAEASAAGMPHPLLAWTGEATSLAQFMDGFVKIGGGPIDEWPAERFEPLVEYIQSLRAPEPLAPGDGAAIDRGRQVFSSAGCLDCHQGPRGSGIEIFTYDEIGTDDAMRYWGDPGLTGTLCCGLGNGQTNLMHGVKSPRLTGVWSYSRLLHNGALGSLEELFCLQARPASLGHALGTDGHEYGCNLSEAERQDLLAFVRSL